MKYLITVEYDGSKYFGLQKLNDKKTIQGELEHVLSKIDEKPVQVKAASRTDRGVHALNQKCHFTLEKPITPYRLRYYLNRSTDNGIFIKDCKVIEDDNFHARFSAKSKTYIYKINTGEYSAINNDYLYNYNQSLKIKKLRQIAKYFIGQHNYKAFVTGKHRTYDSIIEKIKILQKRSIIYIEIKGLAFYTYMVRNIVSIMILYSENKISKKDIIDMIENQKKILEYSPAPACGLYLKEIEY